MPETAAFCPGCGLAMQAPLRAQGKVGVFSEKVAGALAYLSFVPAAAFLLLEPYKKNRFVRFHSLQCLFLSGAALLIAVLLKLLSRILFFIPIIGHLLAFLIAVVVCLAAAAIWVVLVIKALQGEAFKLPVLGDFAEQQAGEPQS